MRLNAFSPGKDSKKSAKRVGRGIGSGVGKTCGRGHKGQHSRSGGFHKIGFEGGQMPLQRRLPKRGFRSRKVRDISEVRLDQLSSLTAELIDLGILKSANLVPAPARRAKIIASGKLTKPVILRGLLLTKGARAAVHAIGGNVQE